MEERNMAYKPIDDPKKQALEQKVAAIKKIGENAPAITDPVVAEFATKLHDSYGMIFSAFRQKLIDELKKPNHEAFKNNATDFLDLVRDAVRQEYTKIATAYESTVTKTVDGVNQHCTLKAVATKIENAVRNYDPYA